MCGLKDEGIESAVDYGYCAGEACRSITDEVLYGAAKLL